MTNDLAGFVRQLFPASSRELRALHDSAVENGGLLHADFLSIQDVLAISGYQEHESLHVVLLLMFLALQEGSLCIEASQTGLNRRLAELVEEDDARRWAERIMADLQAERFPSLIGTSPVESKPVLLFDPDPAAGGSRFLYFHRFLRSELTLTDQLRRRLPVDDPNPTRQRGFIDDWQPILDNVLHEMPLQTGGKPLLLDREQLLALERALTRNFVIISGGPGTGKTSIVLTLLRCLVRGGVQPERIALAAPTGRAAQRLTDSLREGLEKIVGAVSCQTADAADCRLATCPTLQACTLHSLLEYSPTRGYFRRHAENPLAADVVIVDEVSMVGVVLMAQLLQALRPECKLVLLGDKDQLPSVEAGAVLGGLVASLPDHVVLLQTNHRSQTGIQDAATAINRQDASLAERLPALNLPVEDWDPARWLAAERQGGCWLLEQSGPQPTELRHILQRWAAHHFLGDYRRKVHDCELKPGMEDDPAVQIQLRELFKLLGGSRILTLVREGAWGCVGINQYLDAYLRPSLDRGSRGNLFIGAPVLITANDHVRRLYNGDVGLTLRSPSGLRAVFPRRGGFRSFAVESLPAHELGLALTVHKSQGSEYDSVLLVLPFGGRKLMTKEILYTGITRARNLAFLAGSRASLRFGILRKYLRESAVLTRGLPPAA